MPAHTRPRSSRSSRKPLSHALADGYLTGALAAGYEVRRVEVAQLDFLILRTQQDFEHGQMPKALVEAAVSLGFLHFAGKISRC